MDSCGKFNLYLREKVVHNFLKCINPKVKIIVWLEFELADSNNAVQHLSYSVAEIHPTTGLNFPGQVAIPRPKISVCPAIYP